MYKWVLSLFSLFTISCVYFNLYYNIEEYHRKGIVAEQKREGTGKVNLEKSSKKAAILIKKYPRSKWAKPALLIRGINSFYLKDYNEAIKILEYYISIWGNDKESKALYYLFLSYLYANKLTEAERILKSFKKEKEKILFYEITLREKQKDTLQALFLAKKYLKKYKKRRLRVIKELSNIYSGLGEIDSSLHYLKEYVRLSPTSEENYTARLELAESYIKHNRFKEAIKIIDDMDENLYYSFKEKIKIIKAKAYFYTGRYKEAESILKEMRTGEAAFFLAQIYEKENKIDESIAYYDSVSLRFADANYKILALRKKKLLEMELDSILSPDSAQYTLAETYLINLSDVNNALKEYETFIKRYPESELYPKALYAIGWIKKYKTNDTSYSYFFKTIIDSFPNDTFLVNRARKELYVSRDSGK